MAKKVTMEEKKSKILHFFHESKEFYTLKELESIFPKKLGINYKQVKEIIDALVSDELIRTEKLGISNYFWSFPSQGLIVKRKKVLSLVKSNDELNENIKNISIKIEEESKARKDKEREVLINEYEKLKEKENEFINELKQYEKCDPVVFNEKKLKIISIKNDINKYIDYIYELQSYCSNKFNMDTSTFNQNFNIPEDMDYVQ
ncbi:hypothetical protein H312_01474 [Anncaliia algerae PRA339]|uniref:Meiotic nuclear division protein 1 n=1 Tax=Anncaliia algerae PRA339 TaxID=1288291 RepID=A0A059F1G8_9MICR|nr:hypothetical protein H312_01474 [Anncaliia algerae PRA339]